MDKDTSNLAAQVTLNRTFNRLNDVLEEEGVHLVARYNGAPALMLASTRHQMKWYEGVRTHAYKQDRPPIDWDAFLAQQTEINTQKEHDYDKAFTKGLVQFGRSVWDWEAHKKLNRIRTWITKGELRVKGDGIVNAVGDLFNYTVLYHTWLEATALHKDPLRADNVTNFYRIASMYTPKEWVHHLIDEELIAEAEHDLQGIVFTFMAGVGAAYR